MVVFTAGEEALEDDLSKMTSGLSSGRLQCPLMCSNSWIWARNTYSSAKQNTWHILTLPNTTLFKLTTHMPCLYHKSPRAQIADQDVCRLKQVGLKTGLETFGSTKINRQTENRAIRGLMSGRRD